MRYAIGLTLVTLTVCAWGEGALYVNLDSGWAQQSGLPSVTAVNATQFSNTLFPSVWSGDIGYNHDFDPYIGLGAEAGAGYFGKANYTFSTGNSTFKSFAMSFLGTLTGHYKQADFLVKTGLARMNVRITGLNQDSYSRAHMEVAAGTAYRFTPHVAMQLTYLHIFGDDVASLTNSYSTPSINAVLIGVKFIF